MNSFRIVKEALLMFRLHKVSVYDSFRWKPPHRDEQVWGLTNSWEAVALARDCSYQADVSRARAVFDVGKRYHRDPWRITLCRGTLE